MALGLQGTKRTKRIYRKYTNGLGKGRRYMSQYKKVNIDVRKSSHERRFRQSGRT